MFNLMPSLFQQIYFQTIATELFVNLLSTFVIIIIILFLFIPNIQVVLMTLSCVVFTVVNVEGYSHFMGLYIEDVTSIIIILSVGLAVDYCAHVSVAYVLQINQPSSRQEKTELALADMGPAVFNGGFSTFLAFFMVAWSNSYVFLTFFKMFSMVVLFGLFHGLIYFPVLLSLIGPSSHRKRHEEPINNQSSDQSKTTHL